MSLGKYHDIVNPALDWKPASHASDILSKHWQSRSHQLATDLLTWENFWNKWDSNLRSRWPTFSSTIALHMQRLRPSSHRAMGMNADFWAMFSHAACFRTLIHQWGWDEWYMSQWRGTVASAGCTVFEHSSPQSRASPSQYRSWFIFLSWIFGTGNL